MSDIIPTPKEFAITMQSLKGGDLEISHVEMDDAIVKLLRQLGYGEAMDIYESQHKWYA